MGKKYSKFLIYFFISFLFATDSFSSESDNLKLNFRAALDIAFDQNPQMMEARKAIESARGDMITSRTLKNPEAELEFGGFKKSEDTNLNSIEIKQPLDPLGVRYLRSKIASNQIQIQTELLRSSWSLVYSQVREVYSKIVFDIKQLELSQDNLNAIRQFYGRVQERYQSGEVLKNDFQRAKIELLQTQHAYLTAEKNLRTDQARLNLLLGRPLETTFEVEEKLEEEHLQASFEKLKSLALSNRPDLKISELELDSKKKNVVREQLNRLPSYFVGLKRTDELDEGEDYSVLVGISLPLWNLNQGGVKRAKAEMEAQTSKNQNAINLALFEVYELYLDAELAQKQFELSKKSLEEANELLRLAHLRYSEGEIDLLNYLDQIKTARQSKINYYEDSFDLSRSISALEASIYSSLRQEEFFDALTSPQNHK